MSKWYYRLWAPFLCFAIWFSALRFLPWEVAFPIMVAAAAAGGATVIYVLVGTTRG